MAFTREKNDTSNKNRERRFFTCEKTFQFLREKLFEKNFSRRMSAKLHCKGHCKLQATSAYWRWEFWRETHTPLWLLIRRVITSRKLGWNSFVCFTVDEENCGEPANQQRKGKNRTRRKLKLYFLSELLSFVFYLISLYTNWPFYFNLNSFV